ncbi:MAG: cupin domain-containing protein [Parachlamydia sp.]|nr:cupin domain-containing protein [Parachlamydia sp.]
MKTKLFTILVSMVSFLPLLAQAHGLDEVDLSRVEEVKVIDPEALKWGETVYPGTEITNVFGDPKKPGQVYTIRFRLPANYVVPPHTHSQDEYMTVISGSLNVGIGETVDKNNTVLLPVGGAIGIPGKVPHYAWTTEEMIMQVHAIGPRDTTFVPSP